MALSHTFSSIRMWYGTPGPFQVDQSSMEPPPSIESVFSHKISIFGHLETWIGAWNWQKRLPHQWSHVWGRFWCARCKFYAYTRSQQPKIWPKRSKNKKKYPYYGYFFVIFWPFWSHFQLLWSHLCIKLAPSAPKPSSYIGPLMRQPFLPVPGTYPGFQGSKNEYFIAKFRPNGTAWLQARPIHLEMAWCALSHPNGWEKIAILWLFLIWFDRDLVWFWAISDVWKYRLGRELLH